jgi:hypothetical protein
LNKEAKMSAKSDEIRKRCQESHRELIELEDRARIKEAAEKLRNEPPHYHLVYDAAEPFSDEQKNAERAEEDAHKQRTALRMRNLYFSVSDVELRKLLIAKDREEREIGLTWWRQELNDANAKLDMSRTSSGNWWLWASICGVAFIGFGYRYFGVPGALCGLLVGYLSSRKIEADAHRSRDSAVEIAENEAKEAEKVWNEVRNEPPMFSRAEARSGNRDPEPL